MENTLTITTAPELQTIEVSKAQKIQETFFPMVEMLNKFDERFDAIKLSSEIITESVCKDAKRLRLDIAKVRIETDKLRKSEKEEYLRAGKAIDGVANILKWAVAEKETFLQNIENHFENIEKERLLELQSHRVYLISEYVENADMMNLSGMDEDVFNAYWSAKKKEYFDKIEAEKHAEIERAEKQEQDRLERIRIEEENKKLREEREVQRLAQEEEHRLIALHNAKIEAERKLEREEAEKKLREEREEKARLDSELAQRKAEDERIALEKLANEQAEFSKGDAEKVSDLIYDLEIFCAKYEFKSQKNKTMLKKLSLSFDGLIKSVRDFQAGK